MGAAQKILTIMGVIYTIIGGGVLIAMIFSAMIFTSGVPLVMYLLPAVFLLLGIGFLKMQKSIILTVMELNGRLSFQPHLRKVPMNTQSE